MKKVPKILVPIDFSDCSNNAFRYAMRVADQINGTIELLHVIYPGAPILDQPISTEIFLEERIKAARASLRKTEEEIMTQTLVHLKNTPSIVADIEVGGPVRTIVDISKRDDVSLIIMGTRGHHDLLERTVGSVAFGTVRGAECPVMIIPENADYDPEMVIAYATDFRESDPFEIWRVADLFESFKPTIRCLHLDSEKGSKKGSLSMEKLEAFFSKKAPELQIAFHEISSQNFKEDLHAFTEIYGVNCLVMYRPHRNFFERIFHNSLTKEMVLHTKVPLMILNES